MAQQNSELLATAVHFFKHDMSDRLSTIDQFIDQGLDMIISNPPYIGLDEKEHMRDNVLYHEPHLALFVDGEDVLIHYRDVAYWAERYLNINGIVCVEINTHYAEACLEIFQEKGFTSSIIKDMYGKPRMILGHRGN